MMNGMMPKWGGRAAGWEEGNIQLILLRIHVSLSAYALWREKHEAAMTYFPGAFPEGETRGTSRSKVEKWFKK